MLEEAPNDDVVFRFLICSEEIDNSSHVPERTIGASTVASRKRLLLAGAGEETGV
jgi:hypothetical protein